MYNCAKIIDCPVENIFLPAFAVELVHTISLLHDDVIDSDLKRRGADTINSLFDNKTAVFLGNYLIQSLFYLLSKEHEYLKEILLRKLSEICRGELMQNSYFKTKKKINKKDIMGIAKKKTGALFSLSAVLPCLYRKINDESRKMFEECGYAFGISYQLLDDFKDLAKDFEKNRNLRSNLNYPIQLVKEQDLEFIGDGENKFKKKILKKTFFKINSISLNIKKKIDEKLHSKEVEDFYRYTEREIDAISHEILK